MVNSVENMRARQGLAETLWRLKLYDELGQTVDIERKERLLLLAGQSHQVVEITEEILRQAEKLEASGFESYDAIHLACAEEAKVDIFLTTDDKIQKTANRKKEVFSFMVSNPVRWLEEVLK